MASEVEESESLTMQSTTGAGVEEMPELGVEKNFQKGDESYNDITAVKQKVSESHSKKEYQKSNVLIEQVSVESNSREFTGTVGNSYSEEIRKGLSFEACKTEEEKQETSIDSEPEIREQITKPEGPIESDPNMTPHGDLQESIKAMNKEEIASGDASEEVCKSPKMSAETIMPDVPETIFELTASTISSMDDKQYTEDDIRGNTPPSGKAEKESKLPNDQREDIMQSSLQEFTSVKEGNSVDDDDDSEVRDVEQEHNQLDSEARQFSSTLLKPAAEGTLEHVNDETEEENDQGIKIKNSVAPLKATDNSSTKSTEIPRQTETIPLKSDREGKSLQDLSHRKEQGYEGTSPMDPQNEADKQDESGIVSCAEEEAYITSESQLSYQEELIPRQIISEGEDIVDSSTDENATNLTEKKLTDNSAIIKECSKDKELEVHESKTIENSQEKKSEDDSYVDQLSEPARIDATNTSCEVGLAGEKIPAGILENDEIQSCLKETEVDENEVISEMVKQNKSLSESDSEEENIRPKTSISTESGSKFEEENISCQDCQPYSSDQTACATKSTVPCSDNAIGYCSDKENACSSNENNKISSLNDSRSKEPIDTEVTETDMLSEKQLDSLTLKGIKLTDETGLTEDGRQNIPLLHDGQSTDDVRDEAFEAVGKENTDEEKDDIIHTPDKPVGNEPHVVRHIDIVKPEIEDTIESDQGEQNQENSIPDAIGSDGDDEDNFTERESPNLSNDTEKVDDRMEEAIFQLEKNNIENVELCSIRDVTSEEENPEPHGTAGNQEACTNSAVSADNVTCEANINVCEETSKGVDTQCPESADHLVHEDLNENRPLSITCLDRRLEAEDASSKTADSDKEVEKLQYTEENQSNTYATDENLPNVMRDDIDDHKNFENTDAYPPRQQSETNSNISNKNEESYECKELKHHGSNELAAEDNINIEEPINQIYEKGSSSNEEGIQKTTEVSPSQDECTKIHDNSIHAIEVEDSTEKKHEDTEDGIPYSTHDDVLAGQSLQADAADKIQYISDCAIDYKNSTTVSEVVEYGSDDYSKVMDCTDEKPAEQLQDAHCEKQGLAMKEVESERMAEESSNKDRDFDQLTEDLEHNNFRQSIDEGAQKDIQPVLHGAKSDVEELNVNTMQCSERSGTESHNFKTQNDGKEQEEGECNETTGTADVIDPDTENGRSTGFHSSSGKLDQDVTEESRPYSGVENPITTNEEIPSKSSKAVQVIEIENENEVETDCDVSSKEVNTAMISEQTLIEQDNDRSTTHSECKQVHDDQTQHKILPDVEIGESYQTEDKDIINEKLEHDKISSVMPDRETLSPLEASRQKIGAATDDPAQNEPFEIGNDKVHTIEVREESGFGTEQHIQTNDEDEHAEEISSEKTIQVCSDDKLQCITKSAVGCEDSTTFAETDSHRSEDKSKVGDTDTTDREPAQKLHEVYSENQDLSIKEENFVTEAEVSLNKAQNFDQDLEHKNETKTIEKEGAHKDVQQLLGEESDLEVIYGNSSSSGNGIETESSEVELDEAPSQEDQMREAPPGKSQTSNAVLDPELGIQEQSAERGKVEAELDSNKPNVTVKDVEMVTSETILQEAPQKSNSMKLSVVNSTEESQQKDDKKETLSELDDLHLTSQDYESENVTSAASRPDQSVQKWDSNDAYQKENVSNVTISSMNFHNIDEITPDETLQTQGEQAVEPHKNFWPPSSASEEKSTSHVKKESSMTLQELNKDKEEQPSTTEKPDMSEETERELPAAEVVSKPEKLLTPETEDDNDPLDSEMMESRSPIDGCPHEIESEDNQASLRNDACSAPIPEKCGQACQEIASSQEKTRSLEQVTELTNEEETIEDIIEERDGLAVKSEITVEESASEESYESQGLSTYDKTEENIHAYSDDKLQCITKSALGCEDSTTVAETNSYKSEDESKVVDILDSTDRETGQKLHESYSHNQDITIMEEDFVTEVSLNKAQNFDQVTKDFEHNNDTQSIEKEVAHKDGKEALNGEGSDVEEFPEINDRSMQLGEKSGTESDNLTFQNDGQKDEKGGCDETDQIATVTDLEKENETPTESHSGKVDQEFALESIQYSGDDKIDNPNTSKDEGTEIYCKENQVVEQEEEVVSDGQHNSEFERPDLNSCSISPKENMEAVAVVEEYKCSFESTEAREVNKTEDEATNSKGENLGSNNDEDLNVNETKKKLDEDFIVHAEVAHQTEEKIPMYEDYKTSERDSTQEGCQETLADEHQIDQVEHMGTDYALQVENEGNTFVHDEKIQEVEIAQDMYKFNEINESGSSKYEETVNRGFEDDCTIKSASNTQTSTNTEAPEGNIGAETPIQDKEECTNNTESGIKVSGIQNIEEAENHEQNHEALVDDLNKHKVIYGNSSSSGNGMDRESSEVPHCELQSQEKQMKDASPGKSRTCNAFLDSELGIQEQSTAGEVEPDSIKPNVTAESIEMVINETSLQEAPHNMKLLVENSTEEIDDEKEMPSEMGDLELTSRDFESENISLAASRQDQSVQECEANDANQEENVSNVTISSLICHNVGEMTQDETVQTQEKQALEPHKNLCLPSSDSKSTITIQDKEGMPMTLQELNKDKEEEPSSETTTQEPCLPEQTQRELPAAAVMSKMEKVLVPETQGASDPLDTEQVESCGHTVGSSHETESEDNSVQHETQTAKVSLKKDACSEPISEKYGQADKEVTENQAETRTIEERRELNNKEQATEDTIQERGDLAVKSEITVEESTSKDSYESQEISTYDKTKEKLVPASPEEMVEISSKPIVYKAESKKSEEEIIEETEETNAMPEDPEPKFSELESDAEKEEKTLINTECNTKSDKYSISISEDAKEISEESNISLVSEIKEGETVVETSQHDTERERTDNEVKFVESKVAASELLQEINFPEPGNVDVQKEKEQESAKELDICSTLETPQEDERKLVAEKAGTLVAEEIIGNNEQQGDVSSREIDAGQSEVKPDLDKFESGGELNKASTQQIDCQDEKQITAAEIIASHICLGIETEEQLKTLVTHADEKTSADHNLHDEKTESTFTSFDNPMEIIRPPEVRPREVEHPNIDHEPKQEVEERLQTMAGSAAPGLAELSLELECAESRPESIPSGKSNSDADEPPLAILNLKEIYDINEQGEIVVYSQLNKKSDQISEQSPGSSCKTSTNNHEKPEHLEQINEIQSEVAISKEIVKDTPPHFELYEAATTIAAREQVEFMESRVETAELSHEIIVPEAHDVEAQNKKVEELEKGLGICISQEAQQQNDSQWVTEKARKLVIGEIVCSSELQGGASLREVDAGQLVAKPSLDEIESGGKFADVSTRQIDCEDDKEITAAEIIANRIYLGIETDEQVEQLKTLATDADDKTFKDHDLHEEKKEKMFTSFDSPVEHICSTELREREIEHPNLDDEPIRDFKQEKEVEERIQTTDGSAVPILEELSLEVEGVGRRSESLPSGESKREADEPPLAISNVKEIEDLNEKGEIDASPQTNLDSHPISEESLRSSCKTSTYNHENPETSEQINEIQRVKVATSKEVVMDTPTQKVKDEQMIENSISNFEFHEAATTDAARKEDSSENPALAQHILLASKSCDEEKNSLMEDKQSADATFSVSTVSGMKETPTIGTNPSEQKDSGQQPPTEQVSNQDNVSTQIIQEDKEEKLRDNYEELHLSSHLQELSGNAPINERAEEVVDTVGDIHNQSRSTPITESSSLAPVESVTTANEEIMAEEHNETEVKSMPPNSGKTKSAVYSRKEGDHIAVEKNLQAEVKPAAEELRTEKETENKKNDLRKEDSELKPIVSETTRDMELKTPHKKSQNILSGMSSKMKHSISKVKKAMACTSPQFAPEDVIVKLNKSRKS